MPLSQPADELGGSQASRVARRLRIAILEGELTPGERVYPQRLAERLSVSVTPVREALRELAAEGLIEHRPQFPMRVLPVSYQEAKELYELRLVLEPWAVERSIQRGDRQWEDELTRAYTQLQETSPHDRSAYIQIHRDFHRAVRAACDSQWHMRIVQQLTDYSDRYRALGRIPHGDEESVADEHQLIYEACRTRNTAVALDLTTRHLQATLNTISELALHDTKPESQ
ncbi:GntR family transcriptional regulator [Pseudonocardia sp. NPDC049635]|uniref:GntR family transcriptional regulator n=1 Tax=Pseudonocardia sp. NPDC049635 TaxID=3155506 RepID=UPI00340B3A34